MCVKNGQNVLTSSIDSILQQTFSDLELIVVDDGSEDKTMRLLTFLARKDTRLRVLGAASMGVAAALNLAFETSRAPFIARMDADDIADRCRLAKQLHYLAMNPHVDVVGTQMQLFTEQGFLGKTNFPLSHKSIALQLHYRNAIAHPTVVMRSKDLAQVGGYRPFPLGQDYDLWLRLRDAGVQFANLPESLLLYRLSESSRSPQQSEREVQKQLWSLVIHRSNQLHDASKSINKPHLLTSGITWDLKWSKLYSLEWKDLLMLLPPEMQIRASILTRQDSLGRLLGQLYCVAASPRTFRNVIRRQISFAAGDLARQAMVRRRFAVVVLSAFLGVILAPILTIIRFSTSRSWSTSMH